MHFLRRFLVYTLLAVFVLMPAGRSWAQEYTPEEKSAIDAAYRQAHWTTVAAGACIGAYSPEDAPEFGYLRDYGWKIVPHNVQKGKLEANFIVAKNKSRRGGDVCIVAFRGSASKATGSLIEYGPKCLTEVLIWPNSSNMLIGRRKIKLCRWCIKASTIM